MNCFFDDLMLAYLTGMASRLCIALSDSSSSSGQNILLMGKCQLFSIVYIVGWPSCYVIGSFFEFYFCHAFVSRFDVGVHFSISPAVCLSILMNGYLCD